MTNKSLEATRIAEEEEEQELKKEAKEEASKAVEANLPAGEADEDPS